jgi:hypothetical protein
MLGSWDDLTTAGTPEFLNSKAGEILSKSPNKLQAFFYIYCTHGRASTPYRIGLSARDIYAPAQDGWPGGKRKTAVGNHGCFNTQARGRDTPVALVADRWLLALLAFGLGSSVGAPARNLEICFPSAACVLGSAACACFCLMRPVRIELSGLERTRASPRYVHIRRHKL